MISCPKMAATSDEEMEKLVKLVDQISDDYITGINEIETLKSNLNAEISIRQALELNCSNLKLENERLKNLHLETLNNLLYQLQQSGNSNTLKEELAKLNEEFRRKEENHKVEIESTKRNHEEKIRGLEREIGELLNQKRDDEATIYQLHHELISIRKKLSEIEERYKDEIEDLRVCVCVEQQEKEALSKKIGVLEKELLVVRTRMADQHVSTSDKQLEVMKQKMMKLRRDNELLRRQANNVSK